MHTSATPSPHSDGLATFGHSAITGQSSRAIPGLHPFGAAVPLPVNGPIKQSLVREVRSPSGPSSGSDIPALLEHVAILRDELAQIREEVEQNSDVDLFDEALPEYQSSPN